MEVSMQIDSLAVLWTAFLPALQAAAEGPHRLMQGPRGGNTLPLRGNVASLV